MTLIVIIIIFEDVVDVIVIVIFSSVCVCAVCTIHKYGRNNGLCRVLRAATLGLTQFLFFCLRTWRTPVYLGQPPK